MYYFDILLYAHISSLLPPGALVDSKTLKSFIENIMMCWKEHRLRVTIDLISKPGSSVFSDFPLLALSGRQVFKHGESLLQDKGRSGQIWELDSDITNSQDCCTLWMVFVLHECNISYSYPWKVYVKFSVYLRLFLIYLFMEIIFKCPWDEMFALNNHTYVVRTESRCDWSMFKILIHTQLHSNLLPHKINVYIACLACKQYRSFRRLVKIYPEVTISKRFLLLCVVLFSGVGGKGGFFQSEK